MRNEGNYSCLAEVRLIKIGIVLSSSANLSIGIDSKCFYVWYKSSFVGATCTVYQRKYSKYQDVYDLSLYLSQSMDWSQLLFFLLHNLCRYPLKIVANNNMAAN